MTYNTSIINTGQTSAARTLHLISQFTSASGSSPASSVTNTLAGWIPSQTGCWGFQSNKETYFSCFVWDWAQVIRYCAYCDLAALPSQTSISMISMPRNQAENVTINPTFQLLESPQSWFHTPTPGATAVLDPNCLSTAEVTVCDQMLHQSFVSALIRWATTEPVRWGNGCSCSNTQPYEDKTQPANMSVWGRNKTLKATDHFGRAGGGQHEDWGPWKVLKW